MAFVAGPTANLGNISDFRASILESMTTDESSTLDFSALTEVDLTFLQVLAATFKLAERDSKSVQLRQPPAPALAALMERAGFGGSDGWDWTNNCTAGATGQ